jgi:hypothetical protein
VGAVFLWSATLAGALGLGTVSLVLGGIVAALALLAAVTGLCVGCVLYRVAAQVRGVHSLKVHHVDLSELGVPAGQGAVVQFTHPLCSDCQTLVARLRAEGRAPVLVDVSRRPDLARRYGVAIVPLAFEVDASGAVRGRLAG